MAILPSKPSQTILREWREQQRNAGFFFWLEIIGRKDEEVKEILYKSDDKEVVVGFYDGGTSQTHIELEY